MSASLSKQFIDLITGNTPINSISKGTATGAEMADLSAARDALKKHAANQNAGLDGILGTFKRNIDTKEAAATASKKLFDSVGDVTKGLDSAASHLGDGKFDKARSAITGSKSKAEGLIREIKGLKVTGEAQTTLVAEHIKSLEEVVKKAGEASKKLGTGKPKEGVVSASQDLIREATKAAEPVTKEISSRYAAAVKGLEATYDRVSNILTGKAKYKHNTGQVHPKGHKFEGKPIYEFRSMNADVAQEAAKARTVYDKIVDPEKLAKDTANNPHIKGAERARETTSAAAKAGEGLWTKFVGNTKANFGKDASLLSKGMRVGGTGIGLAVVYDGITRGKSGDQDRSTMVRIGEVAAGLGIAGASLAAFRR